MRPRSSWSATWCAMSRPTCAGRVIWIRRRQRRRGGSRVRSREARGARSGPPLRLFYLDSRRFADRDTGERVLGKRDVLVADTAVEIELESLPLPQEDHRLSASSVVQPFF